MNENNLDFSKYMTTGPLLKSAWLLASNNTGILVNLSRPSVRGLFAFGDLGRLHNVLYDMDCMSLYSDRYGIYPYYTIEEEEVYPFRNGLVLWSEESYDIFRNQDISVSEQDKSISFKNLSMFAKGSQKSASNMPLLTFEVKENKFFITAEYPENAKKCGIHLPWYPLYDTYTVASEKKKKIQYYRDGFYGSFDDHFTENIDRTVTLEDTLSRQASIRITVKGGTLCLHGCTKKEYGNALYLSTDAYTSTRKLEVVIELLPATATVYGQHYYPCGTEAEITIKEGTTLRKQTFHVDEKPGEQVVKIDDKRIFNYCAVPNDLDMMKLAADACLKIFWKEGDLEGVPPYAFDPTLLEPHLRSGLSYCSHGMRSMSILCAEGVRSGDILYVDAANHAIQQVAKVSYHGEDGSVFTPLGMEANGNSAHYSNSCRPSDTGIIIRGIVQVAKAYLHFGKNEEARECVQLASNYSKILSKMQCEDGSFFERYSYPTLEPSVTNKGTVNNWCLQLWRLLPLLRYFNMEEDAVRVELLIKKYIHYQIEKENSIIYTSGGGEDISDFGDALNVDATLFTMQYSLTGNSIWKEYAEQALKKSWLMSCMWADMPQFFGVYGNSHLGYYYDQPMGIFSAGGMHDLTAVEANLFAAETFGSEFAADNAELLHNVRLGSFIRDNGGMYMVILKCPGFYHRDERHSEMLMYGGVGVYAWYGAECESSILQNIFRSNGQGRKKQITKGVSV